MGVSTPWGESDSSTVLADGIISYSTPSHGGIWLSPERRKLIAPVGAINFLGDNTWWEEDCDWSVPFWFFRNDIRAYYHDTESVDRSIEAARDTIRHWHPECADRLLGVIRSVPISA